MKNQKKKEAKKRAAAFALQDTKGNPVVCVGAPPSSIHTFIHSQVSKGLVPCKTRRSAPHL